MRGECFVNSAQPFEPFGTAHLLTLLVLCLVGFAIVYGAHRWTSKEQAKRIAAAMGVFMIVQELVDRGCHHFLNHEPFVNVLPFHLCGASVFLTAVMLINRSRLIYPLMYFWGLAGASMSILTPDIQFGFPHILNITYFSSHALIIVGVLYMTVNFQYRPTLKSLYGVAIFTNAYLVLMIPINIVLKTNYLFICEKPKGDTLLNYLGPWPWYILSLEGVGILFFLLLYSPYLVRDYVARKRRANAESRESAPV